MQTSLSAIGVVSGELAVVQALHGMIHGSSISGELQSADSQISGSLSVDSSLSGSLSVEPSLSGSVSNIEALSGEICIYIGEAPLYDGAYVITPTTTSQTMDTRGKRMMNDVTVSQIPYYETTNASGGYTVCIG